MTQVEWRVRGERVRRRTQRHGFLNVLVRFEGQEGVKKVDLLKLTKIKMEK